MKRFGKIAHLPPHIVEELNHLLERRTPGRLILPWLNSHPDVQPILQASFHSQPVNHQNLTNWRRGGFLEWQTRRNFLSACSELAADAAAIEESLGSLTDHAARLLALHFSQILCPQDVIHGRPRTAPDFSGPSIKLLCHITSAVSSLRRGDHAATRLKLQQQKQTAKPEERAPVTPPIEVGVPPLGGAERSETGELAANIFEPAINPASTPPPPTPPRPIKAVQANSSLFTHLPFAFSPSPQSPNFRRWMLDVQCSMFSPSPSSSPPAPRPPLLSNPSPLRRYFYDAARHLSHDFRLCPQKKPQAIRGRGRSECAAS